MTKQMRKTKLELIKTLFEKKDFFQAMTLCNEIDWSTVKNVRDLVIASDIYKVNGKFDEAFRCLEFAYDCVPVGKRILYQMLNLALDTENIERAEEYMEEYERRSFNDSETLILRYRLGRLKKKTPETLIPILKQYLEENLDEQWSYELAKLYAENNQIEECVDMCDYVILWFSVGEYVDKAIELKSQFAELTEEQIEKRDNKTKFQARLRQVELEYRSPEDIQVLTNRRQQEEEAARLAARGIVASQVEVPTIKPEMIEKEDSLVENLSADKDTSAEEVSPTKEFTIKIPSFRSKAQSSEKIYQRIQQAKENLKQEVWMNRESEQMPDNISDMLPKEEEESKNIEEEALSEERNQAEDDKTAKTEEIFPKVSNDLLINTREIVLEGRAWHLAVRCSVPEKGYDYAVKRIRELSQEHPTEGYPSEIMRTTGMQLNIYGIAKKSEEFLGKAMILESAGELADARMKELFDLMQQNILIVFVDYPERLERFLRRYPNMTSKISQVETAVVYDEDSLLDYGQKYADQRDYVFREDALLVLDRVIKRILLSDKEHPEKEVEQYIDEVIQYSEKSGFMRTVKDIFFVRYDKEHRLILKKEDLEKVDWKENLE
ncbi:MAG: hypothetical protein ACI4C1_03185 [Lachnospiraceae bacterium]